MRKLTTFHFTLLATSVLFIQFAIAGQIIQLTDNSYYDGSPQIHNGQVVWCAVNSGDEEEEIFFWNGSNVQQLTDNSYGDFGQQIHNGQVVWHGFDGNDYEIFYWDGSSVQQLTDNSYNDWYPQIHNGQVVWNGFDGNDDEIFFWDGSRVHQLTDNSYDDFGQQIHNGQVVWCGDYNEVFYWDGSSVQQLTDNNYRDGLPQIHNGRVVWPGFDGNDDEIFFWEENILEVVIDIKPGSYPNSINLKSKGKIPVAILSTDDFDAYDVDPDTCVFAGAYPVRWNTEDVDHDGNFDMLFHFFTQELDLNQNSIEASLECETDDGMPVIGTDTVNIVPKGKGLGNYAKESKKGK
jgi:hypothetical protein